MLTFDQFINSKKLIIGREQFNEFHYLPEFSFVGYAYSDQCVIEIVTDPRKGDVKYAVCIDNYLYTSDSLIDAEDSLYNIYKSLEA